ATGGGVNVEPVACPVEGHHLREAEVCESLWIVVVRHEQPASRGERLPASIVNFAAGAHGRTTLTTVASAERATRSASTVNPLRTPGRPLPICVNQRCRSVGIPSRNSPL